MISCVILLSVWCSPHVRPMFSLWIWLSKLCRTPCGKSSTGDRLLLCVMWKVSIAFSFLSVYQPQKIFLFPPLPIIGPYNAHRNPISYTFWKLHLVWPVRSPVCMVCLLLYCYFWPHYFWFLAQVCLQNVTLSSIGLSKTLIWIYSLTFILRSRFYWFACYTKSTHNIQTVLFLWNNF